MHRWRTCSKASETRTGTHKWQYNNRQNSTLYRSIHRDKVHKQLFRSVLKKRCSENIQEIYRTAPMPKCDFNKVALQLYQNHTSAWLFYYAAYFQNTYLKNTSGRLLLKGACAEDRGNMAIRPGCIWNKHLQGASTVSMCSSKGNVLSPSNQWSPLVLLKL